MACGNIWKCRGWSQTFIVFCLAVAVLSAMSAFLFQSCELGRLDILKPFLPKAARGATFETMQPWQSGQYYRDPMTATPEERDMILAENQRALRERVRLLEARDDAIESEHKSMNLLLFSNLVAVIISLVLYILTHRNARRNASL